MYYDAVNEKGLGMAGLNFVGNAVYAEEPKEGSRNVAQFEFIPWILSQCATLAEAKSLLEEMNLTGTLVQRTASVCTAALDHCGCNRCDYGRVGGGRIEGIRKSGRSAYQ